jgi:hypothetical protein
MRTRRLIMLLLFMLLPAVAFAGPLVDPTADPVAFVTQVIGFVHTCWPLALALGAYGALEVVVWLGKNVPFLAWLDTGRKTMVIAGVIGVLGAGLNSYMGNPNLQSAFIAVLGAVAAYWHPQAGASLTDDQVEKLATARALKRASNKSGGFTIREMMFALAVIGTMGMAILVSQPSCSKVDSAATTVENDIVDCTKGELAKAETIAVGLAPAVFTGAITIASVEAAALLVGGDVGVCILTDLGDQIAQLATGNGSGSGSGSAAKMKAPIDIGQVIDDYRKQSGYKKHVHGATHDY